MRYKPWYTPEQNLHIGIREGNSKSLKQSNTNKQEVAKQSEIVVEEQVLSMNKDFKDYTMNHCIRYVNYIESKVEKAYKCFEAKNYNEYKAIYKEIKYELKSDLAVLKKLKNDNEIIETHLFHAVQEAYLHMTEKTNSVKYQAIYSCLDDVVVYLQYYFRHK